jgi:hypothetical protein
VTLTTVLWLLFTIFLGISAGDDRMSLMRSYMAGAGEGFGTPGTIGIDFRIKRLQVAGTDVKLQVPWWWWWWWHCWRSHASQ